MNQICSDCSLEPLTTSQVRLVSASLRFHLQRGPASIIKKLTWMLVNVAVSPLPNIMKNQETPENFLDPLCLV